MTWSPRWGRASRQWYSAERSGPIGPVISGVPRVEASARLADIHTKPGDGKLMTYTGSAIRVSRNFMNRRPGTSRREPLRRAMANGSRYRRRLLQRSPVALDIRARPRCCDTSLLKDLNAAGLGRQSAGSPSALLPSGGRMARRLGSTRRAIAWSGHPRCERLVEAIRARRRPVHPRSAPPSGAANSFTYRIPRSRISAISGSVSRPFFGLYASTGAFTNFRTRLSREWRPRTPACGGSRPSGRARRRDRSTCTSPCRCRSAS